MCVIFVRFCILLLVTVRISVESVFDSVRLELLQEVCVIVVRFVILLPDTANMPPENSWDSLWLVRSPHVFVTLVLFCFVFAMSNVYLQSHIEMSTRLHRHGP